MSPGTNMLRSLLRILLCESSGGRFVVGADAEPEFSLPAWERLAFVSLS